MWLLKAEQRRGLLVVNVYSVHTVLNGAGVIEHDGRRKGKLLAQLGRIDGVGKGIMQLAPWVRPPPVRVPPLGRCVALGQQVLDDGVKK